MLRRIEAIREKALYGIPEEDPGRQTYAVNDDQTDFFIVRPVVAIRRRHLPDSQNPAI